MITGIQNNPYFKEGMCGLAVGAKLNFLDDSTDHVIRALEEVGFRARSIHEASQGNQLSDFPPERFTMLESTLQPNDPRFCSRKVEGIVAEELTNFAHSTTVSASVLETVYNMHVPNAACLLFYGQPKARQALELEGMDMIHLITLPELLHTARHLGTHLGKSIKGYRSYLADPVGWNTKRGIERKEGGGTL